MPSRVHCASVEPLNYGLGPLVQQGDSKCDGTGVTLIMFPLFGRQATAIETGSVVAPLINLSALPCRCHNQTAQAKQACMGQLNDCYHKVMFCQLLI